MKLGPDVTHGKRPERAVNEAAKPTRLANQLFMIMKYLLLFVKQYSPTARC